MTQRDGDYTLSNREPIPGDYTTAGRSASYENKHDDDERIRADVCDRLMQFGPEDCTTIDVSVRDGIVLLGGDLASQAMAARAIEVARSVKGVRDVDNQLRFPES
jgi:osmotically-inducible protein OsmY